MASFPDDFAGEEAFLRYLAEIPLGSPAIESDQEELLEPPVVLVERDLEPPESVEEQPVAVANLVGDVVAVGSDEDTIPFIDDSEGDDVDEVDDTWPANWYTEDGLTVPEMVDRLKFITPFYEAFPPDVLDEKPVCSWKDCWFATCMCKRLIDFVRLTCGCVYHRECYLRYLRDELLPFQLERRYSAVPLCIKCDRDNRVYRRVYRRRMNAAKVKWIRTYADTPARRPQNFMVYSPRYHMLEKALREEEPVSVSLDVISDNMCAICFMAFESGDVIPRLTCGHVFHNECVLGLAKATWHCPHLLRGDCPPIGCPLCREMIFEQDAGWGIVMTMRLDLKGITFGECSAFSIPGEPDVISELKKIPLDWHYVDIDAEKTYEPLVISHYWAIFRVDGHYIVFERRHSGEFALKMETLESLGIREVLIWVTMGRGDNRLAFEAVGRGGKLPGLFEYRGITIISSMEAYNEVRGTYWKICPERGNKFRYCKDVVEFLCTLASD